MASAGRAGEGGEEFARQMLRNGSCTHRQEALSQCERNCNPQACPEAAAFRQGGQQSAEHLPDKDAQQSQCTRGRRHVADTIPQKKTAEAL